MNARNLLTSRQVAICGLLGILLGLALFAICCLTGCSTVANYDRDYAAIYDTSTNGYQAGVTIRRAKTPGQGTSSLTLNLRGDGKEVIR